MWRELILGLLVVDLGRIGLGHTHLGGGARLPSPQLSHPCLMIGSCVLFALLLIVGIP